MRSMNSLNGQIMSLHFFVTLKKKMCVILAGPSLDKSLKRSVKHKRHHNTTINTCGHCKTHQLWRREETASARPLAPAPLLTITSEHNTSNTFGSSQCRASPESSRTPIAAHPISPTCACHFWMSRMCERDMLESLREVMGAE